MNILILAAGRGSRLGDLTTSNPKVLSRFRGRTLLEWHVLNIRRVSPNLPITVVIGYKSEMFANLSLNYIFNPFWSTQNIGSSLWAARELLSSKPTLVIYGDVFYESELIDGMLNSKLPCVASVSNWNSIWSSRFNNPLSDLESFLVDEAHGRLLEIGKKPTSLSEIQGQFAGVFSLDVDTWQSLAHLDNLANMDTTTLIQSEINSGREFGVYRYSGVWREFDLPTDFTAIY